MDYDVVTDDEASSTSDVVSVAKDLVSGTENVTYDGQSVPVSSAAFVDSSGTNGIDIVILKMLGIKFIADFH